jgi:hypothetical protein
VGRANVEPSELPRRHDGDDHDEAGGIIEGYELKQPSPCMSPKAASGLHFKLIQVASKLEQAFDKRGLTGYTTANSE